MNTYQEIREIESQIRELSNKKKELEDSLTSGFLQSGGLELLQNVTWSCRSTESDNIVSSLNNYTARIFRVKMGLAELYGSILLNDEGLRLRIDDDDDIFLSVNHSERILPVIRKYNLKLNLAENRSSISFQENQIRYQKEDLAKLEEFEIVD